MTSSQEHRPLRLLLTLAAFIVVISGMKAAEAMIVPFLLSLFIAVICAPALFWLQKRGIPLGLDLALLLIGILGVNILLGMLVGNSMKDFSSNLELYQTRLGAMAEQLVLFLAQWNITLPSGLISDQFNPGAVMKLASRLFGAFSSVLTNAFLIILTVIFLLGEAANIPGKLKLAMRDPDRSFAQLKTVLDTIKRYMLIKSSVSLATGLIIYAGLLLIGVDYPILWALLAFLLNFVPNIGSIIAAVPPVLLALVQLGPMAAVATAGTFLVVNILMGNLIEPRYMGRGLGLSTLVVFLSLIFWGWVLGPVGMLLSVPLTMTLKIALEASDSTRWLAILLGNEVAEENAQ